MIDDEAERAKKIASACQVLFDDFVGANVGILTRAEAADGLLTVAIANVTQARGITPTAESLKSAVWLLEEGAKAAIGTPRLAAKDGILLN